MRRLRASAAYAKTARGRRRAAQGASRVQTVICMKWGKAYGADYANKLRSMVSRNTRRPLRFICFTDDAAGLSPEIEALPLPPIALPPSHAWTPWRKISLWQRGL